MASIYNDPTPNKISLIRNGGGKFEEALSETEAPDQLTKPNPVVLKAGGPQFVAGLWIADQGATFRLVDYSGGKAKVVAEAAGLTKGTEYVLGHFGGRPTAGSSVLQEGDEQCDHPGV